VSSSIKYKTIVIDPPWSETGGGRIKRGADKHYSVLSTPDIIKAVHQSPVWDNVDDDAHLYLWATNSFLPDGLKVMDALGFRYITNICWSKNHMGLGQYFRGKHELCLFGVRGKGFVNRTSDRTISSVIEAKKTGHSRKPEAFYSMVEHRSNGPYLDMFSRQKRKGWTCWGDEVPVTEEAEE
jgi:N6-adenosine-specific RNA methylase IME4